MNPSKRKTDMSYYIEQFDPEVYQAIVDELKRETEHL